MSLIIKKRFLGFLNRYPTLDDIQFQWQFRGEGEWQGWLITSWKDWKKKGLEVFCVKHKLKSDAKCENILSKFECLHKYIRDKVFKNGLSKICGRQPLKNLKEYDLLGSFLNNLSHMIYLLQCLVSCEGNFIKLWAILRVTCPTSPNKIMYLPRKFCSFSGPCL